MTAHKTAYQNAKSGRATKKLGHFSETDVRYWQDGLFRETYRKNGRLHHTSGWYARIQHQGRILLILLIGLIAGILELQIIWRPNREALRDCGILLHALINFKTDSSDTKNCSERN
jgi:hypothetical protein